MDRRQRRKGWRQRATGLSLGSDACCACAVARLLGLGGGKLLLHQITVHPLARHFARLDLEHLTDKPLFGEQGRWRGTYYTDVLRIRSRTAYRHYRHTQLLMRYPCTSQPYPEYNIRCVNAARRRDLVSLLQADSRYLRLRRPLRLPARSSAPLDSSVCLVEQMDT
jgi:hypothetical protein